MSKRTLLAVFVALALAVAVVVPSAAFSPAGNQKGRVNLHPENGSGVIGLITIIDTGSELVFRGRARGLDPGKPYVSLIYDNESVAHGPLACEPGIFDPNDPEYILETMFIGFWSVDSNGNGTLSATNVVDETTGQQVYVPLDLFKTVSIRDLTVNEGFGPDAVVACGVESSAGF